MTNRHDGASLQNTFYVDRDDIRHLARLSGNGRREHINWEAATNAGFERLVAPTALIVSYFETVVGALFDTSTAGRLTDLTMGFKMVPVYAGDRISVSVQVAVWIEDTQCACVTMEALKADSNQPLAVGTVWVDLK